MTMRSHTISPSAQPPRLRPGQDGRHTTFCRICEAFCGLRVDVADGRMTRIRPDPDNLASQGHLCVKGVAALAVAYDPDRVVTPLKRVGGPGDFAPVSWEEAMAHIAERLATILRRDGPDAIANYIGNPAAYSTGGLLGIRPFLAHFGVWKLFASTTLDLSSRMLASYILYGSTFRLAIPDLPRCDFLLMFGANPLVSHGSILTAPRIREDLAAIAARGRVVAVDPRRTETAARFEHVSIRPDTDVWMLAAMVNVILDHRPERHAAVEGMQGWTEFRAAIGSITPELAERHCGVTASETVALALALADTPRAAVYSRVGLCRGSFSTLANLLIDALNIVAGNFGVEGGWVFGDSPLDMSAVRPAGYDVRETRFGPQPRVSNTLHLSLLPKEITTPGEGQVRALLMESGNVVVSAPGGDQLAAALETLELFVSHDIYVNETNRHAHYILPGATFLEREDMPTISFPHMVRPFAQYTDAVVRPTGEARAEHVVFNDLGRRLHDLLSADPGASGYAAAAAPLCDPMATVDDHFAATGAQAPIDGKMVPLTVDLLKAMPEGIILADNLVCTNSLGKVRHPDGIHLWNALLDDEVIRMRGTAPPAAGDLRLFGMRTLGSINSWMHNVDRLVRSQKPMLLIHPEDAASRGIVTGDMVVIRSDSGTLRVKCDVTDAVAPGAVCYPHGWGHRGGWRRANATPGANINMLADPEAGEKLSASSLLDGIRVEVTRVTK